MLHMIDWKAELAKLESDNASDCEVGGGSPARVHLALTEPCLDDQLLRMYVERELANLMGE
jgi:hypothetical protein